MFDVKIINGTVVDGVSNERYLADIGIEGQFITAIGDLKDAEAKETIDATGKIVSPGFIDTHTHSDVSVLADPHCSARLHDGVTSEVIANCGIGLAPISDDRKEDLKKYLSTRLVASIPVEVTLPWNTSKEYFDAVDAVHPCTNIIPLLAQGPIRVKTMGFSDAKPTEEQMNQMKADIRQAMEEGCVGMSTGLTYMPGAYTSEEELTELLKEIAPFNGVYTTHMRNEGPRVFQCIEESIRTTKNAGVALHISHLKLMSPKVYGKTSYLFEMLESAKAAGQDVTWDSYPYNAGCTSLGACMPPWAFEGGVPALMERLADPEMRKKMTHDIVEGIPGWENFYQACGGWDNIPICCVFTKEAQKYLGMFIGDAARMEGKDAFEFVYDFMIQEQSRIQIITKDAMNAEDVRYVMGNPYTMIGSDSMSLSTEGLLAVNKPHPRAFGTHGRFLGHYVRDQKIGTLEQAIKRLTSMAAKRFNVEKRGALKEGYYADVTVFDYNEIIDTATFSDSLSYTKGIEHVIVNGKVALRNGVETESYSGRVLRGGK